MPVPTMTLDDSELRRLIASGKRLGSVALTRLRNTADAIGLKLQSRAVPRAPLGDTGALRGGATTETTQGSAGLTTTVMFGGLASAYAEVQHENDSYTHTRADWVAKYGTSTGARSSLKTGKTSYRNASGKTQKIKGHKGGQAHFLYGAGNSAYDAWFERWSQGVMERKLEQIVGEVLG
jgi:hypothetical protein